MAAEANTIRIGTVGTHTTNIIIQEWIFAPFFTRLRNVLFKVKRFGSVVAAFRRIAQLCSKELSDRRKRP